jgi:uncharacterized cupin superfamily protein
MDVPEARIETNEDGAAAVSEGWFVLNAREARWRHRPGRGDVLSFDDEAAPFAQVGVNIFVLGPGEPMSMYHWEADQEDFLVLAGEALLIVDGEERPLRQWDFVHTPPGVSHTIVGAGSGPCVVVAVGARDQQDGPDWGGYPLNDVAARHNAAAEEETTDPQVAYGRFERGRPAPYRDGLLPDL